MLNFSNDLPYPATVLPMQAVALPFIKLPKLYILGYPCTTEHAVASIHVDVA